MALTSQTITLRVSGSIAASRESYQDYTPPAGSRVIIELFGAEGFYDRNSMCKLIWKFNHGQESEDILWAIRGSGRMPSELILSESDTDGIRSLAVTCDNADLTPVIMSGLAKLRVYING